MMLSPLVQENSRLILRPYRKEDRPALSRILCDPVIMGFWPFHFDEKMVDDWLEKALHAPLHAGLGRRVIEIKNEGIMIGDCGITRMEVNGKMEYDLGYIVSAEYWGKGLGTEAAGLLMSHAFRNHGIKRIVCQMSVLHEASRRVAEKLAMRRECRFNNRKNLNNPTYLYSCTLEDYEKSNNTG